MRQVGEKELEFVMMLAVRRFGTAIVKGLGSNVTETRSRAEKLAASHLVASLARYELMIDAPPFPGDDGKIMPNGKSAV
jgi:hypothetical protein